MSESSQYLIDLFIYAYEKIVNITYFFIRAFVNYFDFFQWKMDNRVLIKYNAVFKIINISIKKKQKIMMIDMFQFYVICFNFLINF